MVVDSHSTDRTRDIARSYGAKVYEEDWKGYVAQKNSALRKCTKEWILCLDADEVVSEELKRSILEELQDPKADGYLVNRRTYYLGKFLKYVWQPEWRLRLVRRDAQPVWVGEDPHDRLEIKGKTKKLKGDLLHFSYKSLIDHVHRSVRYSRIAAENRYRSYNKRFLVFDIWIRPLWTFVKFYLIKGGFLDGWRGFVASVISSFYTFLKYAFILELYLKDRYGSKLWDTD